jgi:cardiolipin hydrolase
MSRTPSAGWTALAGAAVLPAVSLASPQAYFSSQDNLQYQVSSAIDRSQTSLRVALFELTSKPLIQTLRRAAERGVNVQILLNATGASADLQNTLPANLEVRYLPGRRGGVMHNKFMVVDQAQLLTGSFNWTPGAQYANYENILMEDDTGVIAAYGRQFDLLWSQASREPGIPARPRYSRKKTHHRRKDAAGL